MFDSVNGGWVPINIIVIICGWFISKVELTAIRVTLALFVPVVVSFSWVFLPRLPALFRPLQFGEDSWVPWGIMAGVAWSAVALPISLVAVTIFVRVRRRQLRKEDS